MDIEAQLQGIANAVPPPYARAIGAKLNDARFLEFLSPREDTQGIAAIVKRNGAGVKVKQEQS